MITARNYATQVAHELTINKIEGWNTKDFKKWIDNNELAAVIDKSVHFTLPDGGKVFDDDFKGIRGDVLKLPFNGITIEYFIDDKVRTIETVKNATSYVDTKRLIFANQGNDHVLIGTCVFIPKLFKWFGNPALLKILNKDFKVGCNEYDYLTTSPTISKQETEAYRNNLGKAFCTVLELLEALSCRNITTEVLEEVDPKVNERRIKKGKRPLQETLVLTLKADETRRVGNGSGGTHASPRQHLRRGHIRRLEKGNIWINSMIVGDASKGSVKTNYRVTK